ncbi:MAG: DUF72 domain-containing protein [Acidobacteriota bacterium]|nr:DUF72 domain-containing protein [Acidobacteriota bacterium]
MDTSGATRCDLRIGTSGWHYKHWVGTFYPLRTAPAKMLPFYLEHFDTVEVNNSFYHLPKKPALEHWRTSTPADFTFAVKGSRFLTHMKKLKDSEVGLGRFLDAVEVLGEKLGPILFQLPPNWEIDLQRFRSFLALLPQYHRYAFEFRNQSWETPATYSLLREYNTGYCVFDLAGYQTPIRLTSDFAYVRLHGPGGKYQGSYADDVLASWAEQITRWQAELRAVYVYFDNDDSGFAPSNALRLKQLISSSS